MKVTEYEGHKVPEGATHYSRGLPLELFYRFNSHNEAFYFNRKWIRSNACAVFIKDNLVELPEQPAKADEWVPVVGEECLGRKFIDETYEECKVVYIDGDGVLALFNSHHTKGLPPKAPYWCESTKPLKTAEEKKREAFNSSVLKELYKIEEILDIVGDRKLKENSIAKVLFDAGFTAPKEEDQ